MKLLSLIEPAHKSDLDEKYHQLNIYNIRDTLTWYEYFKLLIGIDGSIVECGVGRGRSLAIISAINNLLKAEEGGSRKIYAYDSFEGFPEPTKEDDSYRRPKKGDWSKSPSGRYLYTPEFIKTVLTEAGIGFDDSSLVITKGFFGNSLLKHPNEPIALLHVDADLYQSYKDVLTNLYNKVTMGGIIVFDDVLSIEPSETRWPGALLAVKEFLGEKTLKMKVSGKGNYFLIKNL